MGPRRGLPRDGLHPQHRGLREATPTLLPGLGVGNLVTCGEMLLVGCSNARDTVATLHGQVIGEDLTGGVHGAAAAEDIGVIADPEITMVKLQADQPFAILATDGVWEFISSQKAVDIVSEEGVGCTWLLICGYALALVR